MYFSRPFLTTQKNAQGTSGATTGIVPTGANILELQTNTSQIIVHNKDAAQVLYLMSYNPTLDAAVDLVEMFEIGAGAYFTLSLGIRSQSVGIRKIFGVNTTAGNTTFKVMEIFSIEE